MPSPAKTPMFLSELLLGLEDVVAEQGGKLAPLLEATGIPASALGTTDLQYPHKALTELLELGAEQCNCPTFGLKLAERQENFASGTFIQMLKSAPNLQAMEKLAADYRPFHSEATYWDIDIEGDYTTVIRRSDYPLDVHYIQYRLFLLAKSYLFLRSLFTRNWAPKTVYVSFGKPVCDRQIASFFNTNISYNHEFDGLLIETADRKRDVVGANKDLLSLLKKHADQLNPAFDSDNSYLTKTRRVILQTLDSGNCNLETVAEQLDVSSRKLQRELNAEGTSFRDLLNKTRYDVAIQYLEQTEVPLTQLSQLLGYSELSAFSRGFKQFCGHTPEEWRKEKR